MRVQYGMLAVFFSAVLVVYSCFRYYEPVHGLLDTIPTTMGDELSNIKMRPQPSSLKYNTQMIIQDVDHREVPETDKSVHVESEIKHIPEESGASGPCTAENCKLPSCFCAGTSGPPNIDPDDIPQMVMLTVDDAVSSRVFELMEQLSSKPRTNPNGCPVSFTFYVSDTWTDGVGDNMSDYTLVRRLYDSGHEIASHGMSHRFPSEWWRLNATLEDFYEFSTQRDNINAKTGIPKSEIKGMRIPFLKQGGDKPMIMIKDVGMEYESTALAGPFPNGGAWPYTMDFTPERDYCQRRGCPTSTFPGIWELPLNQWMMKDDRTCCMADTCARKLHGFNETLDYMWYNFHRFYTQNRAPLGVHIHAKFFNDDVSNLHATSAFLDGLSEMDDVYLVSPSQIIDWMKQPTPLKDINNFLPWKNTCSRNPST